MTSYDEELKKATAWLLLWVSLAFAIFFLFCSCTTTEYVTVPEYHTKYVTKSDTLREKEYVHDSVSVYVKGDTVYKDRWHTSYKDRWNIMVKDSVVRDSVPYPVEVEKKLTKAQKMKLDLFWYVFGAAAVFIVMLAMALRRCIKSGNLVL